MSFYHDTRRDLLVYPQRNAFITAQLQQTIPETRVLNGSYLAVPRSLRNLQVLRLFDYAVPQIMEGYDWPRHPSIAHPYESQKVAANFMVLHPRCFNLSDMGCVAGETKIDTLYGEIPIADLAKAGKPVVLRTLTKYGPRLTQVPPPFEKGRDKLYRVTFQSGRSIVVTKRHVFLTCRGWVSCENLAVSELLPVFDVYPQQSSWEPSHVKFLQDAHRWKQITSNYLGYYETLLYDAPPLSVSNIDQGAIPSLGGVLERIPFEWQTDAAGNKYIHTSRTATDRRSTLHYGARIDQGEMGSFLSECATKLTGNQFHIFAQYHLSPTRQQEARADQVLSLCIPLHAASGPPFDTVVHIAYDRRDVYYDFHVPETENYTAHGLCHHNTGKTMSVLWAADWLMRQHAPGTFRALIVCPLSIMQRVWADAIFRNFLDKRTFSILHGSAEQRIAALDRPADFYIINFDGVGIGAHTRKRFELDGFSARLAERKDIQLAVVDEASAYKDATTRRHRVSRLVFGQKPYLWLLSGTPTPNAPTDAYGLAKLVNNAHGKSFKTFQFETMYQPFPGSFKWLPKRDGYDQARKLLSPAIRFDIKQVWDGPPLTTQQREVALTKEQQEHMAALKRDLVVVLKTGQPISAANEAAARLKFIQVSLGAIYDAQHNVHLIDSKPRLDELKAVIEEAPGKILIFSPLTSIVNLLYKELKDWTREIVNGDVGAKDRARIFSAFQQERDPRLLIADPNTMAHGLDLYAAQTVIWYGTIEKTELYLQANKRAHRPGQRFPVSVVQLVSNPLEREIYRRLENNETLQGALLDAVRKGEL